MGKQCLLEWCVEDRKTLDGGRVDFSEMSFIELDKLKKRKIEKQVERGDGRMKFVIDPLAWKLRANFQFCNLV